MIGPEGKDDIRDELRRIGDELQDLRERGMDGSQVAERLQGKQEELLRILQCQLGKGGKSRLLGANQPAKDHDAVRKALQRMDGKFRDRLPEFADHLVVTLDYEEQRITYLPERDAKHPSPTWEF